MREYYIIYINNANFFLFYFFYQSLPNRRTICCSAAMVQRFFLEHALFWFYLICIEKRTNGTCTGTYYKVNSSRLVILPHVFVLAFAVQKMRTFLYSKKRRHKIHVIPQTDLVTFFLKGSFLCKYAILCHPIGSVGCLIC